ncbi:MAG: hypothetical protein IKJ01_05755 [Lachnospiraceae bacterium]|nr:hypothetical protein [Lachnospiraceae bacterium]
MITFVSEYAYYGLKIPAIRDGKKRVLDVWVGYERGHEGNFMTWDILERGFYLYLNLREEISDYPYYMYMGDGESMYKVLLKKVNRKRKADAILAGKIAVKYFDRILKQVFPDVTFLMNEFRGFTWSGKGTGVSLFSGFFIPQSFQFDGLEDEYTL